MKLEKYSIGIGDRFGKECIPQLEAIQLANQNGIDLVPVWNKSYREHSIIGSNPSNTQKIIQSAVKEFKWNKSFYLDADHITLKSVDHFLDYSNFFTLDVGEFINKRASDEEINSFLKIVSSFKGKVKIDGLEKMYDVDGSLLLMVAEKYLAAIKEAGKIYRHILSKKSDGDFVVEVSFDEVDQAQSPIDLFFILAAVAQEKIPIQTIAPKFVGKFLKGIDYIGDLTEFENEFKEIILIIEQSKKIFDLPQNLKLSVHSGSDKFSIYPIIKKIIKKHNTGIHVKTAGTTWLEELIGLALSGDRGLSLVKDIYTEGYQRYDELLQPYLHSVEIQKYKLPTPAEVNTWDQEKLIAALRHEPLSKTLNVNLRQLLHISFRIAAEKGIIYYDAMDEARTSINRCVTENLFERHIKPIFL
ncbi:MAG: tagaturonate epimerase family protein [Ignavibacteriales bacterium]|nr:tagaturonate epimerase family protein [Ignavibacteriales bacterium]